MSRSARWKADRIREQIYLEQLKQKRTERLPNRAGLNAVNSPGGTPLMAVIQVRRERSLQ
jgi:hypothetical protein